MPAPPGPAERASRRALGIKLPANVVADPCVVSATKDADVLIFVLPHQFLGGLCKKILGNTRPGCETRRAAARPARRPRGPRRRATPGASALRRQRTK